MATITLTKNDFKIQVTYTATNGTLTVTELKGCRTDGYHSYNKDQTSVSVNVGGTSKTISLSNYIDFPANSSYATWGATDKSWTELSGNSISISVTMPDSTQAYDQLVFSGSATMSWDTYTITYNKGTYGSGTNTTATKTYGTSLTLNGAIFTRTGYTQTAWASNAAGTTKAYNLSASYTDNSDDTLYPYWTANTLKVYYNANGGSITSDTYYLSSNDIYITSDKTKSYQNWSYNNTKTNGLVNASTFGIYKTGYTFAGWGTSSSGGTIFDQSDTSLVPTDLKPSIEDGDTTLTLYAQWTENKLTVNYYSNYATESFADALNTVGADKNVIVRTVTYNYDNEYTNGHWDYSYIDASTYLGRMGYTGTGYWGTSINGGTLVSQSSSYATGQAMAEVVGKSLETSNATIDLYAQWQINTYTINYNANGGSGSMDSQTVEWNELFIFAKNTFVREGYKFIGWNLYRNDDDKWYAESQGWLTEDEILTNNYSKRLYIDQRELTLDESWIRGNEKNTTNFTLYAVWEISGVVYIDNGVTLEPYLVYVDNGTDWDLHIAYVDNGSSWNLIS